MASKDGFSFYSNGKSVIEPSIYSKPLGPADAVICYQSEWYELLLDSFRLREGKDMPHFPGLVCGKRNEKIAVCHSSFGAPAAAMLLEKLAAGGVKRVLMLGQAGSISPECRIGDILVPAWGIREEGTSYHYIPSGEHIKPSARLVQKIKKCLTGTNYREGGVWTTDAPYRETFDKVREYSGRGALAVEMECTALMAVASCRGVDFAAILVISDELHGGSWKDGFGSPEVAGSERTVSKIAAKIFV